MANIILVILDGPYYIAPIILPILCGPYNMAHIIWFILYGPYYMAHIIWAISVRTIMNLWFFAYKEVFIYKIISKLSIYSYL